MDAALIGCTLIAGLAIGVAIVAITGSFALGDDASGAPLGHDMDQARHAGTANKVAGHWLYNDR